MSAGQHKTSGLDPNYIAFLSRGGISVEDLKKLTEAQRSELYLSYLHSNAGTPTQTLDVPPTVGVTHWDSLEKKGVLLTTDFKRFSVHVRTAFSDISTGKIRIYSLPHGFDDVGQRKRIDNEAAYSELRQAILSDDPDAIPPLVYVWNAVEGTSPGKLPEYKYTAKESTISTASKASEGSKASRNSHRSSTRRAMDNMTCLCCGYKKNNPWEMPVEGCHILEVRTYTALDEAGKAAKCEALGITGMNDLRNLITLCKGCHLEFDKNEICIHPLNLTWIVGSSARPKPTYVPGKAFSGIHSTLIDFTDQANAPKMVLLEERMSRFLKRHAGELYCHLCPFVTTKGPAEFEAHLPHCTGQNKQPRTIYGDADEDLARLADSNLGIAADDNSGAKVGESVAT